MDPSSAAADWSGDSLLVPGLLILAGAIFGGLRAVLASPLRGALVESLSDDRRRHLRLELEQRGHHLTASAGVLRLACVVAAAALILRQSELLVPAGRWPLFVGAMIFAGLLLEGLPAFAVRGRFVRPLLAAMPLVRLLSLPLRPLTAVIDAGLRAVGADPGGSRTESLAANLIEVAQEQERQAELDDTERRMISRVIDLPEIDAAEVMTPRTDLTAVPADTPLPAALQRSHEDGHSRILVYEEDLDHVVGVFYVKDALHLIAVAADTAGSPVSEHMRRPYFVPETMRVPALLEEMRRRRVHLAVVVDEYGGTAGVVTVEDLLEEIVGEIEDEHDPEDEALHFHRVSEDEIEVDGRYSVAELNEVFGARLPEDKDYDTLAGLLFDRFGHIPSGGERIQVDGVVLEVVEADDRRIQRVRVSRSGPQAESDVA
ncbi:MAG: HlyC/CorC family transporter [Planctomycetes bacterium]|nr:HlyC/CorC family transporter [Planctomycetota bacterium]